MTIEGVIFEERGIDHQDDRRALLTAFNGDLGDFVARQVKFAVINEKEDVCLGGHYHEDYKELFYMLEGNATFYLEDIKTKQKEEYNLIKGSRLLIPLKVAHKAQVEKGSILVGCTEKPYISPEVNDHKYDV